MAWVYLAVAICSEIVGTLQLRALAGGARPAAFAIVAVAYVVSFSALALALRVINVGVAYAIWSAVGTAAVAGLGVVLFGERINWVAAAGMALIVGGVVVLVSSGTVRHG